MRRWLEEEKSLHVGGHRIRLLSAWRGSASFLKSLGEKRAEMRILRSGRSGRSLAFFDEWGLPRHPECFSIGISR